MRSFTHYLVPLTIAFVLVEVAGCRMDVTHDPTLTCDWKEGQVYALQRQVFLENSAPGLLSFDPQGAESPTVVAKVEADRERSEAWYVGLVHVGTRMRFVRAVRYSSVDEDVVRPMVLILDGPFAGREVSAAIISKADYRRDPIMHCVDPDFLIPATNDQLR